MDVLETSVTDCGIHLRSPLHREGLARGTFEGGQTGTHAAKDQAMLQVMHPFFVTGTELGSVTWSKDEYYFRMYEIYYVQNRSTNYFKPNICSIHLQFTGTSLIGCN